MRSDTGPIDPDVVKTETAYWASPHASTNQTLSKHRRAQQQRKGHWEHVGRSVPLDRATQMSLGSIIRVEHLSRINALLFKGRPCCTLQGRGKSTLSHVRVAIKIHQVTPRGPFVTRTCRTSRQIPLRCQTCAVSHVRVRT